MKIRQQGLKCEFHGGRLIGKGRHRVSPSRWEGPSDIEVVVRLSVSWLKRKLHAGSSQLLLSDIHNLENSFFSRRAETHSILCSLFWNMSTEEFSSVCLPPLGINEEGTVLSQRVSRLS